MLIERNYGERNIFKYDLFISIKNGEEKDYAMTAGSNDGDDSDKLDGIA